MGIYIYIRIQSRIYICIHIYSAKSSKVADITAEP